MRFGKSAENRPAISARCMTKDQQFARWKQLLLVVLSVTNLLLLLFSDLLIKSNNVLDVYVPASGLQLISTLSSGFRVYAREYELWVAFPSLPSVLMLGALMLTAVLTVIFAVGTVKNREYPAAKWLASGYVLYTVVVYIFCLVPNGVKTPDFFGVEQDFYQVYAVGDAYLIGMVLAIVTVIVQWGVRPDNYVTVKKFIPFYIMAVLPLAFILVFSIYPVLLQVIMAFKEYTLKEGVWGSKWIGLQNFIKMFEDPQISYVLWNTVWISLLKIILSIVFPLVLALFLFDIRIERYRKSLQTIIYMPYFFSWTVVYAVAYAFLNNEGVLNLLLSSLGLSQEEFLTDSRYFIPVQLITFVWKQGGWGTIIYFAAMVGIDPSLFEAAKLDGAGPLNRMKHITLPSIGPVILFMTILSLGNILKTAGGEQLLLFYNIAVDKEAMVIDTWLYFKGLNELEFGTGSAMLFFQSTVGIVLVLISNKLSKKYAGRTIW